MCRLYGPLLQTLGLTYPQYLVLLVLWQHNAGISVKSLGRALDLDSGTLSPLIKRMEKHGLVKRARQIDDKRVIEITLSQQGKDLEKEALNVPAKMFEVTGLTSEKFEHLNQELDQLIAKISD